MRSHFDEQLAQLSRELTCARRSLRFPPRP